MKEVLCRCKVHLVGIVEVTSEISYLGINHWYGIGVQQFKDSRKLLLQFELQMIMGKQRLINGSEI